MAAGGGWVIATWVVLSLQRIRCIHTEFLLRSTKYCYPIDTEDYLCNGPVRNEGVQVEVPAAAEAGEERGNVVLLVESRGGGMVRATYRIIVFIVSVSRDMDMDVHTECSTTCRMRGPGFGDVHPCRASFSAVP